MSRIVDLYVVSVSNHGVQVSLRKNAIAGFWLPKKQVVWSTAPAAGSTVRAVIPDWLAAQRRELDLQQKGNVG